MPILARRESNGAWGPVVRCRSRARGRARPCGEPGAGGAGCEVDHLGNLAGRASRLQKAGPRAHGRGPQ